MAITTYTDTTRTTVALSPEALKAKELEDRINNSKWDQEADFGGTERGNFGLEALLPKEAHETTCPSCSMIVNRHTGRVGYCASCADDLGY